MLYVTIATSVHCGVCIGAHLRPYIPFCVVAGICGSQHGDAGRAFWVNRARAAIFLCILRPACVETACARAVRTANTRSRLVRNNASLLNLTENLYTLASYSMQGYSCQSVGLLLQEVDVPCYSTRSADFFVVLVQGIFWNVMQRTGCLRMEPAESY